MGAFMFCLRLFTGIRINSRGGLTTHNDRPGSAETSHELASAGYVHPQPQEKTTTEALGHGGAFEVTRHFANDRKTQLFVFSHDQQRAMIQTKAPLCFRASVVVFSWGCGASPRRVRSWLNPAFPRGRAI